MTHLRILFIRRIVQIWYTRIGDAEGKSITSNSPNKVVHREIHFLNSLRESTCRAPQTAARESRGAQEEDELLLNA